MEALITGKPPPLFQVLLGPTLLAGESLSDGIDVTGGDLLRITMPLDWTEAPISFQISTDGGSYNDLFDLTGFEVSMPVVVPRSAVIIPSDTGKAIARLKIRSGLRAAPVPQSADRIFALSVINSYLQTGMTPGVSGEK